jgi:FkbM family methyltransferase
MAGVGNHLVRRFYLRKPRTPVVATVRGFRMELDPAELVDGLLLFGPQLYDRREVRFLRHHLRTGDTFLDLGAHIGFYALVAARLVGPRGKVLAVEPEPITFERLANNLSRNRADNVIAVQAGLSDRAETRTLYVDCSGNRGSSSFLREEGHPVAVECAPLPTLMATHGLGAAAVAKLDLEGFEFRVLHHWFDHLDAPDRPRALIVEHHPDRVKSAGGDTPDLLRGAGYRLRSGSRHNLLAVRESP